jgi:hypothetical protein
MTGLTKHQTTQSGNFKTICVSNVLAAFGIHPDDYKFTYNNRTKSNLTVSILRRAGFHVRSRFSQVKGKTVGGARAKIRKIAKTDPKGVKYLVQVPEHVLLLDENGETIIDTAKRRRDARKILSIYAVYK